MHSHVGNTLYLVETQPEVLIEFSKSMDIFVPVPFKIQSLVNTTLDDSPTSPEKGHVAKHSELSIAISEVDRVQSARVQSRIFDLFASF